MSEEFALLPQLEPCSEFRCIVADPPWEVNRLESPGSEAFGTQDRVLRSVPLEYPTMSVGWPRGKHSAKPEEFQTIVESVSPGPYLEMFARRKRHGWASWGNEVASDVALTSPKE